MTSTGRFHFYTYKEGLLSRLAHDLRLSLARYTITLDSGRIVATFDPRSLTVDGVVHRGDLDADALSESDRAKIEATIQGEVLHTSLHPEVRFEGTVKHEGNWRFVATGTLLLNGRSVELSVPITLGDSVRLDLELIPSRWGIAPFRAMAGTLKVQDRVRVVVELPVVTDTLSSSSWQAARCSWTSP